MTHAIKLLLVQYHPTYLDPIENLRRMEDILRTHARRKPDLVVFPESALTGLPDGHPDLVVTEDDAIIRRLRSLARSSRVHLVPGSIPIRRGRHVVHATCLIAPSGRILGWHEKNVLWGMEVGFFTPRRGATIIQTAIGTIALQICADFQSAILAAAYQRARPDVIINIAMWSNEDDAAYPHAVPKGFEASRPHHLGVARAIESGCYVVYCNWAGKEVVQPRPGMTLRLTSTGNSMVVDPFGRIIARAKSTNDEALLVTLDRRLRYDPPGISR